MGAWKSELPFGRTRLGAGERCGRGVSLLLALLLLAACHGGAKQSGGAGGSAQGSAGGGRSGQPVPVDVAPVEAKAMPVEVRAIGQVEALATVQVRAQVGGTLLRVHFEEGDEVQAGQVLFSIDPRPYAAQVRQIQSVIEHDRIQAKNARKDAQRFAQLAQKNFVAQQQAQNALATANALEETVHASEAQLELARLNLEYCTIRAPITGKVGALLVNAGNVVKANDATLVVLNQVRPVRVNFAIPSMYLSQVQARMRGGQLPVLAQAPGEKGPAHKGRLSFVNNQVDPNTGTLLLKAEFPNEDEALWPGQLVDVTLTLAVQQGALVAPSAAVQQGQEGTFVFVVKDDGTAESRKVAVDRQLGEVTVLAQGVRAGEQVVTDGQLRITPGARVTVRNRGGAGGSVGGGAQPPNQQQNQPNPQPGGGAR